MPRLTGAALRPRLRVFGGALVQPVRREAGIPAIAMRERVRPTALLGAAINAAHRRPRREP